MAYDLVVDSSYLNNGLKAIADGIRQGSGVSGELTFPDGMAEAAAQKSSGMPEIFERLVGLSDGFNGVTSLPDTLTLDLSFIKSGKCVLRQTFRECRNIKDVTLIIPDGAKLALGLCFYSCFSLKTLTMQGSFLHATTEVFPGASVALGAFANCYNLETVNSSTPFGVKYISNASSYYNPFCNCAALKEVRFERQVASNDWVFKWSPVLSDATLISVANALTVGSYTLTLHATAAARCAEIVGTVSDGVFTADSGGTTTLTEFITTTKGWSIVSG